MPGEGASGGEGRGHRAAEEPDGGEEKPTMKLYFWGCKGDTNWILSFSFSPFKSSEKWAKYFPWCETIPLKS